MKNIFSGLYDREFNIPVKIAFMCKFQQFSRHPLLCSYIYMINKYCAFRAGYLGHTIKPAWDIAKSTKGFFKKIF